MTQDKKQLGRVALQQRERREHDAAAEVEALKALSEKHGVPGIDLNQVCIRLDDLDLLPREIAERRLILPVLVRDDRVFVAMTNPGDKKVIDELEFVTGKRVFPYVGLPAALERVIAAAYDGKKTGERFYVGPMCPLEIQRKMGALDMAQPAPSPFVDAPTSRLADEASSERDELSYNDFGAVDPELSVVTDMPGPGTTPRAGSAPSLDESLGGGRTILVVDDEGDIRNILRRVLTNKGFRVVEADRGLEALRLVKANMPDLLLLDAMLPEVNGFEIARRVKSSTKYAHIPIIMVSAVYKGERYADDAKTSYGVDAYIEKPFRINDVLAAIENALSAPRASAPPGGVPGLAPATPSAPSAPVAAPATSTPVPAPARRTPTPQRAPLGSSLATGTSTTPAPAPVAGGATKKRDPEALSADAERHLNAGVDAYRAGNIDKAIEHLKQGIAIDALAYRLRFHLGLLYGKKGLTYDAIQELERAVEQNDRHFPALKNLAVLYQKAGFKKKALDAWERALRVAPDDATRATIEQHLASLRH
jgi:CheY-like chemotaxis protein